MLTPFENDKIRAIPIIPIEPANAVRNVLPFLVLKLLNDNDNAVNIDIEALPIFLCCGS